MTERTFNVLFFVPVIPRVASWPSRFSTRSAMAVSLFSAGSHPSGAVNPYVLELLKQGACRRPTFAAKAGMSSRPRMHRLLILSSPFATTQPGRFARSGQDNQSPGIGGVEDPAFVEGDDETRRKAVSTVSPAIEPPYFVYHPFHRQNWDAMSLKRELDAIGKLREKAE